MSIYQATPRRAVSLLKHLLTSRADRERLILKHAQDIAQASSELLKVEEVAKDICKRIRDNLSYQFVSVQLVDVIEQTIGTVYGSRTAGEWYTIGTHSLEGDPKFLDIQANIAVSDPPVIEIIAGWDDRFDKFIFEKFGHEKFTRAFVPLIVRRDFDGPLTKADPEQFSFEPIGDGLQYSIRLRPKFSYEPTVRPFEIIGTVEAGFDNANRSQPQEISIDRARELFAHCCSYAIELCRTRLDHVLEVITESAREIAEADISSLHYPHQEMAEGQSRQGYEVWAGASYAHALRPRKSGLGEHAIEIDEPRFLRASQPAASDGITFNPDVYAAGIRSMAAFPLIIDKGQQSQILQHTSKKNSAGVLYVGLKDDRDFSEDEKVGLTLFTNLAKDAIRHAVHYAQAIYSARQLASLHDMATALAHETDTRGLLESIAGHALNIMTADVVIIYEYDESEKYFRPEPAVSGRCDTLLGGSGLGEEYTPPLRLVQTSESYERGLKRYARSPDEVIALLSPDNQERTCREFVENEGIRAAIAVPLRMREEVVGVIFITYRRDRDFPDYEHRTIETLALAAAVAIRNRRLLRSRNDVVVAITHQIRTPLSATAVRASGLLEHLRTREHLTDDDRDLLLSRVDEIKAQLEILDILCEGVFATLTQEATGGLGSETRQAVAETFDTQEEVVRLWNFLSSAKGAHDLDLQILDGHSKIPAVKISRWVFTNVVYSLFDNAIKYANRPSTVSINWISLPKGESLLKVRSIGQPIRQDETEKIFRKFGKARRGDQTGAGHGSVGIGLWVARVLMRSVGGEISLELDPGNLYASTFVVRIPQ